MMVFRQGKGSEDDRSLLCLCSSAERATFVLSSNDPVTLGQHGLGVLE